LHSIQNYCFDAFFSDRRQADKIVLNLSITGIRLAQVTTVQGVNFMKKIYIPFLLVLLVFSCQKMSRPLSTVQHPAWSANKTIYEVNLRQFSQSGDFSALEQRLPAIRDLGVGIIWLMPVHPIGEKNRKGSLGSPYSVKDYYGLNPEFGTMDDFKRLVKRIHELGMYVIIDWVANHTAWDNPLIDQHPDWYMRDAGGNAVAPVTDWSDVADLNYDNPELRQYMTEAMKFWIVETGIDGFRCDVAEMVPVDFWDDLRRELQQIKPVFMLAEGEAPNLQFHAFDATYSWKLFYTLLDIRNGKRPATAIDSALYIEKYSYPMTAMRLRFTSNHDENAWRGSDVEMFGDGFKAFAVLAATLPGKPLMYSGQEAGLDKRLQFFEKDPIAWRINDLRIFYTKLFNLYQNNAALCNGRMIKIDAGHNDQVYCFVRKDAANKILVLLNLSGEKQSISINSGELDGKYIEWFSGVPVQYESGHSFDLEPWAYRMYVEKK
jgi:glycosidase